jgi:hypothetical protein
MFSRPPQGSQTQARVGLDAKRGRCFHPKSRSGLHIKQTDLVTERRQKKDIVRAEDGEIGGSRHDLTGRRSNRRKIPSEHMFVGANRGELGPVAAEADTFRWFNSTGERLERDCAGRQRPDEESFILRKLPGSGSRTVRSSAIASRPQAKMNTTQGRMGCSEL